MFAPFHQTRPQGGALAPVVLILVALAISAAVFFLFTKKRIDANQESAPVVATTPDEPAPAAAPAQDGAAPAATAGGGASAAASSSAPTSPATPAPFGFARPADVGEQLSRQLAAGDLAAASKLITAGDPTQEAAALGALEKMKAMGFKAGGPDDVQMVGQVGTAMRLSIPLLKTDGTPTSARLQLDVEKDSKMGWKIGTLHLPKELESAIAAAPMPSAAPTVNPEGGAPLPPGGPRPLNVVHSGGPDALNLASDFVKALLKLDYDTASKYVDEEKVPAV
jgi:hypothetical protein